MAQLSDAADTQRFKGKLSMESSTIKIILDAGAMAKLRDLAKLLTAADATEGETTPEEVLRAVLAGSRFELPTTDQAGTVSQAVELSAIIPDDKPIEARYLAGLVDYLWKYDRKPGTAKLSREHRRYSELLRHGGREIADRFADYAGPDEWVKDELQQQKDHPQPTKMSRYVSTLHRMAAKAAHMVPIESDFE